MAAARELQFEVAARLRDELSELKKELRQLDAAHACGMVRGRARLLLPGQAGRGGDVSLGRGRARRQGRRQELAFIGSGTVSVKCGRDALRPPSGATVTPRPSP